MSPNAHQGTKMHPVLNKFQAHMVLAAASQKHHNQLKHLHQNDAFSPPSQVMSNYASFGPATSNPFWHSGVPKNNGPFHMVYDNRDYQHHHFHRLPESQPHQQVLPSIHPSVITPFIEQVHLKQKEAAAAEQKNSYKQSHESASHENNGSFEVVNDVFSKHLVPPPPSNPSLTNYKQKPSNPPENAEKPNKYNLSMQSPLQDASRFNYNNVISTATPAVPIESFKFRPSASDNTYSTTEKPNVFIHLNRTKDNVYKQHKLLHPSYTGGNRNKPQISEEKPFLPTPYKPDKSKEQTKNEYEPQHSFFTIEDAVTPHIPYQVVKSHIPVVEEAEAIVTRAPPRKTEFNYIATSTQAPPTVAPIEKSTAKPRQKLRRRKPRPPQQKNVLKDANEEVAPTQQSYKPNRVRGSIKNIDTQTEQADLRTRNRVNHPSRVRNRLNFSSPAATSSTSDYDSTVSSSTEEEKRNEITTAQQVTTDTPTSLKSSEETAEPENPKRRVRFRYKNKLRTNTNSLEAADFKSKISDNHISDSEHEHIVVKQSLEVTEANTVTESGFNEMKSSLKLPNLKIRNDAMTTLPTTADTISTSVQPFSTVAIEQDENIVLNQIANRPRFSIKEYKRKPISTASTLLTSPSTAATTTKPDSQRFNRLRINLNRRRNETGESGEEAEVPRRRFSSTRTTSTTTETPTQTSSPFKRTSLPKRTFPARNFTKPTINVNDGETTSLKPLIKSTTSLVSNRPPSPNLRSRIQSYKKKESISDVAEIKNTHLSSDVTVTEEQPSTTTSTEPPYKHETSIMKIAKTPPSINMEKSSTGNFIDETTEISRNDFDLTGSPSDYSQRVSELTISGNDNYSFKSANIGPLSRRIPNYFTISTDDPILPIQAFFPQIKTNESVSFQVD